MTLATGAVVLASAAFAQETGAAETPDYWAGLLRVLIGALVVATILESALTVLFQWRIYRIMFNRRAWKTVFMIAGAAAIVGGFDYDPVHRILVLVDNSASGSDTESMVLSALFLAGGTSGVNTVLRRLGFRSPIRDDPAPTLDETEAWFSVTVLRRQAVGPVNVHLEELSGDVAGDPILGIVDDDWMILKAFRTLFAQPLRYPGYGGRMVTAGQGYRIVVTGMRRGEGETLEPFSKTVWEGRFAARAVADLNVEV